MRQRPSLSRRGASLPEYASCERCGEYAAAALRVVTEHRHEREHGEANASERHILCANCTDTTHTQRRCAICGGMLPSELHHVASERQHPTLLLPVCLNCHRILSARQYRWHPAWRTEAHPLAYVLQGVCDVVCLWLERSPVAEQCRELFALLGRAVIYVLAYLRPDALSEVDYLTNWNAQ